MFTVYILKSINFNWFYVGLSQDPLKRLSQHNNNQVTSSKHYSPLKLIFTKDFSDRLTARNYEKFIKIRSNKEKLLKTLGYL